MHSPALFSAVLLFTASAFSNPLAVRGDQQTPTPSPVSKGIAKDCSKYHHVAKGETCQKVADDNHISLDDFYKWNPAVDKQCSNLLADYYYCVAVDEGHHDQSPKPNGPPSVPPNQDGEEPYKPTCVKYYQAVAGDTCQSIADKNVISKEEIRKWNPGFEKDCKNIKPGIAYCVKKESALNPADVSFRVKTFYHTDCTGEVYRKETSVLRGKSVCMNIDCKVGSLNISTIGDCPKGHVQISYWENKGCSGQRNNGPTPDNPWYGYGYADRGQCRKLWADGWASQSVRLACVDPATDCYKKGQCNYQDPHGNWVCRA